MVFLFGILERRVEVRATVFLFQFIEVVDEGAGEGDREAEGPTQQHVIYKIVIALERKPRCAWQ